MKLGQRLRNRLDRENFLPTFLSTLLRPNSIVRRGLFRAIREFAPGLTGNILDFGCGSKPYESLFPRATSYTGVDLKTTGHDHRNSKIDFFYDGRVLPFEDGRFDAVVSFEVLEHVFNLSEILAEISRVTKDSGMLLVSIPFAWEEHEVPYDFARYTSFGLTHLLGEAGYEVVALRKTTTHLLAVFQMLIAYLTHPTPHSKLLLYGRQIFLAFPCTLLGLVLNRILPKRYDYYCSTVVLARKLPRSGFLSTASVSADRSAA